MSFDTLVDQASRGRPNYENREKYYEAEKHLDALGVTLPSDVRVLEMISSIPKLAVDVLVEVLNVDGFTLKGQTKIVEVLREWWQANNLDTEFPLAMTESLVQGQSYLLVGSGDGDVPSITVHDARYVSTRRDAFGTLVEAVIVFGPGTPSSDFDDDPPRYAAHYTPGTCRTYVEDGVGDWEASGPEVSTNIKGLPLVPLTNRTRLKDFHIGRSEITELLGLANGESRSLTNLQVAQELLALPQRYLFGNGISQLKDQSGNPVSKFKAYMSALWTGPQDAKAGQFPGADLSQIINVIKLYNQKVSAITGIPPSMLGISTDNPTSAEAMRAAKERLITRAEFKQRLFSDPLEDAMRIALEMYDLLPADGARTLEVSWRDVATPSKASRMANLLQAHSQGVISAHLAREHMDLTPEQRAEEDSRESSMGDLMRSIGVPSGQNPAGSSEDDSDAREETSK